MVVLRVLSIDAKEKTAEIELIFPDGRTLKKTVKVDEEFHFHP